MRSIGIAVFAVLVTILTALVFAAGGPKYEGNPSNVLCARPGSSAQEMDSTFHRVGAAQDAPVGSFLSHSEPLGVAWDWTDGASGHDNTQFVDALLATDTFVRLVDNFDACA
jgi:hypothetical protein